MSDNIQFKSKYKLNAGHLGGDTGHGYEIPPDACDLWHSKFREWEIRRGFAHPNSFGSHVKLRGVALRAKTAYLNKLAAQAKKESAKKKPAKKKSIKK